MNPIDALELGWSHGEAIVARLSPPDLDAASACDGWDVRRTLNHTLNVCDMMTRVNRGEPPVVDETVDVLGDGTDIAATWARFGRENVESWRTAGLDGMRTYCWATFPAVVAAAINLGEVVVHGWDVAGAAGMPRTIEPVLAGMVLDVYAASPLDGMREAGELGAAVPVAPGAPAAEQLLGLLGRKA